MSLNTIHKSSGPDRSVSAENPLKKAQIYNDICEYEETLSRLVASVDRFHPDIQAVKDLIEADRKLSESLKSLPKYDEIDARVKKLDQEHEEADKKTARILETLTACHDQLNSLPMLEQIEFERATMLKQREKVFTNVLLDYAMKLAKFTHVPPTFDKGTVGPNNFVWPAEDAMRRGMLAIASLRASGNDVPPELITQDKNNQEESGEVHEEATAPTEEVRLEARRPSFEFDSTRIKEPQDEKHDDDIDLDLDLFNSEEF
ncbi:LANO_0C04588g1_1 [Lachancea nothofagi CBS 11611]|uniref:Mediator of RNA polymerase II transcription subunit 4 n=1 Tax=Lachancea nothofagi CBS 11611 TaxID=1266666 RepID=A0A1G4J6Y4_9SACH|nr:LANO_0C04588g1_1 [Lachancea nothofagi CBS 11611]